VERTQVFEWFSKFRSSVTFVEDGNCLICPLTSKTDENMCCLKENYSKTKESLPVNLLPSGNFIWVTSEHLERESEHVLDCCKVCALRPFTLLCLCMYF